MSIRGIGEHKPITPLSNSKDLTSNNPFTTALPTAGAAGAINFITDQFAAQITSATEPQDNLQKAAKELIEKHTSSWFTLSR